MAEADPAQLEALRFLKSYQEEVGFGEPGPLSAEDRHALVVLTHYIRTRPVTTTHLDSHRAE